MTTILYSHTGTIDATDIGPVDGGILHSITISQPGPHVGSGALTIRDEGDVILRLDGNANNVPLTQLKWIGVRINGQLNIELGHASQKVSVEMSAENVSTVRPSAALSYQE
jgi:hypothetical protein